MDRFCKSPFVLYSREQASFCNSNEPKSGFACDLGDRLRLRNVPLAFPMILWKKRLGRIIYCDILKYSNYILQEVIVLYVCNYELYRTKYGIY